MAPPPAPSPVPAAPAQPETAPQQPENKLTGLVKVAAHVMPQIKAGLEMANGIQGAISLLGLDKPSSSMPGKAVYGVLEPGISRRNEEELNEILRYAVADKILKQLMKIGEMSGLDFSKWKYGKPPPELLTANDTKRTAEPAPAALAPVSPTPVAETANDPAAAAAPPAAPAPPGAPAPEPAGPGGIGGPAKELMDELVKLAGSVETLKKKAIREVQDRIEETFKQWDPIPVFGQYWWNGANEKGIGPGPGPYPNLDNDHDARTLVKLWFKLETCEVPRGMMAGIPEAASHFTPFDIESHPVIPLAIYKGGVCEVESLNGPGDTVTPEFTQPPKLKPGLNPPHGAYDMSLIFHWDRSDTHLKAEVTFNPILGIPSVKCEPREGDEPLT